MSQSSKKLSRAQIKELELIACSQVTIDPTYDLLVIGAGASAFASAIEAARAGLRVLMLEKNLKPAQKILATGNGRCNITNAHLDVKHFNNPQATKGVFGENPEDDIREFLSSLGLALIEETEGRMYPRSLSAASVQELLIAEADRLGITIGCARQATSVSSSDGMYTITFTEEFSKDTSRKKCVAAHSVVIATGGNTCQNIQGLRFNATPQSPTLCALATVPQPHRILDGVRTQANVRLMRKDTCIAEETGEVLFRSYGVSGICIFNLSRHARPGDQLEIDLFYDMSKEQLVEHFEKAASMHVGLLGLLPPKMVEYLEISDHPLDKTPLSFTVKEPANVEAAQVTKGGLILSQFNEATLEAKLYPGLYAVGEALDIDADCGGYNLSWAWLSGLRAAQDIVKKSKGK